MIKKIFSLFIIITFFSFAFAEDLPVESIETDSLDYMTWDMPSNFMTGNDNTSSQCIDDKYLLSWKFNLKSWVYSDFLVQPQEDITIFSPVSGFIKVYYDWEEVYDTDWFSLSYNFPETWEYEIFSYVVDQYWCEYEIWEKVRSYDDIYFYIWDDVDQLWLIESSFEQKDLFLKRVFIPQKTIFLEDEFFQLMSDDIYYFVESDKIIINNSNFPSIFEFLWKLSRIYWLNLSEKDFFLVSSTNTNFIKRTLSQYINKIWITNIYIVDSNNLLNFMDDLSKDDFEAEGKDYLEIFSVSFDEIPKQYFLSYVVDFLIYNEFPISLLGIMLTLSVAVLIVTIFRQIIWFSVFGVYNPILFAVSMLVLWIQLTFILLFIAFLSTLIIRFFTKRIYLLYSAKISLLMIIYFIISFSVLWFDNFIWWNFIDYSVFANSFIIFPLVFLIIVANKVFSENFTLFSKGWIVSFIEFLLVSITIYFVITWPNFQFFMLSYPDMIFIILLINVLVGRFTWLQLLEYLRFMPLLKNKWEEE